MRSPNKCDIDACLKPPCSSASFYRQGAGREMSRGRPKMGRLSACFGVSLWLCVRFSVLRLVLASPFLCLAASASASVYVYFYLYVHAYVYVYVYVHVYVFLFLPLCTMCARLLSVPVVATHSTDDLPELAELLLHHRKMILRLAFAWRRSLPKSNQISIKCGSSTCPVFKLDM